MHHGGFEIALGSRDNVSIRSRPSAPISLLCGRIAPAWRKPATVTSPEKRASATSCVAEITHVASWNS